MSLLMDKTIELLPKNNWNISKSMREAGYADTTSRAGDKIAAVRICAKAKYFDADLIRKEYKRTLIETRKAKDTKNKLHCLDSMSRIEGMFKDNLNTKQDISITEPGKALIDELNAMYARPSSDVLVHTSTHQDALVHDSTKVQTKNV